MTTRSSTKTVVFAHEFHLKVVGRTLPAGPYEVTTEEEQIEYLSFPAYRRVSTVILVPTTPGSASVEMFQLDPVVLEAAQEFDSRAIVAGDFATPPIVGPADDAWSDASMAVRGGAAPAVRSNPAPISAGLAAFRSVVDGARRWLTGGTRI